jgi:3-deoxy-manno-octulosonate cytidylyltransferase (CMP-KDO synthetase)
MSNKKSMIVGFIPARYGSTRFPGKPLIEIHGKPMIQHVWERSLRSKYIDRLIVATDDKRIFNAVKKFGGEVVMTSRNHKSGTDRIGEAVKNIACDIVVNIQGDEPFIDPKNIDRAIEPLLEDKKLNVSTLCFKISDRAEIYDYNVVNVVFDKDYNCLYFSRYPIPYNRDKKLDTDYYKHIGLYVYRKKFLMELIKMKQTKMEKAERLEQLRILENGEKIRAVLTNKDSVSIDTEEDLEKLIKKSRKIYNF